MRPVLFEIFGAEIRSYYLLWASALFLLVVWTRRRASRVYGMDDRAVSSVLVWVYCAGILGSFIPGIIERIPLYLDGRIEFSEIFRGLYSAGGLLCGGLFGLWRLRRLGASADAFADAASVPLAAMLALGRVGCLLEGCCSGAGGFYSEPPALWLHFPSDAPNFWRFPSQPAESAASLCIAVFLCLLSAALPEDARRRGGVLFPFMLILYGLYRLLSDPRRQLYADGLMNVNAFVWAAGIIAGAAWLCRTVKRRLAERR
ncbi:prolipoprotein diacylglyceryl transferase family protein [Cloacibacillus sp. An23]|uniref:prolipoprotein diacylglyceryl transferase family protein n=1 Tax=Cloacibacillus sp. An23 TaxID=1965591 RepID=UPI000B3897A9|nr:prolipoprotein diacylglyceryl transferase family protein [Cloacibacillus sp. An23]OUO93080.1 hypothetical protein B5F39_09565 [Cloacibacillus sp. An23]